MLPTGPLSDDMNPSSCQEVCFLHLSTEVEFNMLLTSPVSDDMNPSSRQEVCFLRLST